MQQTTGKPNNYNNNNTTTNNYFKIPGIILGTVLYYNKPKKYSKHALQVPPLSHVLKKGCEQGAG